MLKIKRSFSLVKTSYKNDDVVILLKDLTDCMKELSTLEREKAIQSGVHYSAMLPQENAPSEDYMKLYGDITKPDNLKYIANLVAILSEMIYNKSVVENELPVMVRLYRAGVSAAMISKIMADKSVDEKELQVIAGLAYAGKPVVKTSEMIYNTLVTKNKLPVIISLARAGIPVGILIKRYLKFHYNIDCPHYAISIIRDKGIDTNAMEYIYSKEVVLNKNNVSNFFFVDGWTGKGTIKSQLKDAVKQLKELNIKKWVGLKDNLYVLADPANITKYCSIKTDYLLPNACLNSTISGLISRTILNEYTDTSKNEFHGAVYFKKFKNIDLSNKFIDDVTEFLNEKPSIEQTQCDISETGMSVVNRICKDFDIEDFKKVKPGIGETTRVLLRRIPWKVLINTSEDDPAIQHIMLLCKDKKVHIERYDLGNYKICGIIKELSADA